MNYDILEHHVAHKIHFAHKNHFFYIYLFKMLFEMSYKCFLLEIINKNDQIFLAD